MLQLYKLYNLYKMSELATSKIFGTGQVTLPKKWRDKFKTKHVIIEEVPQGLLVKPLVPSLYYEADDDNFGVNFPTGISAKELAKNIRKSK